MKKLGAEILRCEICKTPLIQDIFWVIERHEKQISTWPCKQCGKLFTLEYKVETDSYEINKSCSCPLQITQETLGQSVAIWKTKRFTYCDNCFKEAYGNIAFASLGED